MNVVSLDLDTLSTDTANLEILKPGGVEGTGWVITFAGPGHSKAIAWSNENSRRNLRKEQQMEQARANGKKYKAEDREPEEVRRDNIRWVVAHIVDWTPVDIGGGPVAFTEEAATQLLLNPKMSWAILQMIEFLADDRSFTKRSATT
ncbi:MAG: hypothetical protein KF735_02255 [Chelatococcus sp.]|uniref:hypothetical protein n=1 Tax=Chelatococcus sp. TaxID=1953771 RepID=UPI0025C260F1|nr:hypothetical protein [Chelatococcus sp.]MBX3536435.1 hypothetical protein [Chelatococcus sp.]